MTFTLLRVPFVPLKMIIKAMEWNDVVMLSFCSSRMKRIIRATNWKAYELLYGIGQFSASLYIRGFDFEYKEVFSSKTVPQLDESLEVLKLDGPVQEFRATITHRRENDNTFCIEILQKTRDASRLALHNHILHLFQKTPIISVQIDSNTDLTTVNIFENMKNFRLEGDTVRAQFVKDFFSKGDNINGAVVTPSVKGRLQKCPLTIAKHLYMYNSGAHACTLPLHFKGLHAVFNGAECDSFVIRDILKLWISKKALQNLESLKIFLTGERSFDSNIVQQFDAKPWDPSRRPEWYEKVPEFAGMQFHRTKCTDFLDVVRPSDSMVASFMLTRKSFWFYVWN